jgi:hypothetical protein
VWDSVPSVEDACLLQEGFQHLAVVAHAADERQISLVNLSNLSVSCILLSPTGPLIIGAESILSGSAAGQEQRTKARCERSLLHASTRHVRERRARSCDPCLEMQTRCTADAGGPCVHPRFYCTSSAARSRHKPQAAVGRGGLYDANIRLTFGKGKISCCLRKGL